MEKSITDLAENKVLILYLLNKISDGIKSDNLYKIVSAANNINYFYFQELLTDLIDTRLIGSFTKEEDTFIKITSEGKNSLELTKSLLPGILKLKADNIFKSEVSNIAEESSIITEYIPKDENSYTVKCKIIEKNEIIFEISTFAGSRDRAKQISDNWKNNSNIIYPKIINLLLAVDNSGNGDKGDKTNNFDNIDKKENMNNQGYNSDFSSNEFLNGENNEKK